jgi:hypothetical protein
VNAYRTIALNVRQADHPAGISMLETDSLTCC